MMGYKVLVYDNNHYGDESECTDYGVYDRRRSHR
jgi:hypothetical protein